MFETQIVIPCYNEAKRLDTEAFLRFIRLEPRTRFTFVDDGSVDETADVIGELVRSAGNNFSLMRLAKNSGKAEAVRMGMLSVVGHSDADAAGGFVHSHTHATGLRTNAWPAPQFVGYLDADLATPLSAIPQLRENFVEHPDVQVVLGSRVRLLGRQIQRKRSRHYLGRVFATVASLALQLPVYDTQCGAKLFRNCELTRTIFQQPFVSKWVFDVELIGRIRQFAVHNELTAAENLIVEHPLQSWRDVGQSKLKWHSFLVAARDLFLIYIQHRRAMRALHRGGSATRPQSNVQLNVIRQPLGHAEKDFAPTGRRKAI